MINNKLSKMPLTIFFAFIVSNIVNSNADEKVYEPTAVAFSDQPAQIYIVQPV